MAKISARGMEFEYETFGDPSGAPLLLVMGLGAQMITWDEELCELLVGKGFHVVRYDNRDVGLSTRLDHLGVPDIMKVASGEIAPAYTIDDMADDAAAVMDALGIPRAHVVGASMGGFIVQALAIRHPEKVLSLTSIMSGPGGPEMTPPTPDAVAVLLEPPATDREGLIEQGVRGSRVLWAGYFDEERARRKRTAAVDRAVSIAGTARQAAAVFAQPSRAQALGAVRVPTLVVHGDADPLVPLACGVDTAESVPGARLVVIPGMGHALPISCWKRIVEEIATHAA